MKTIMVVFTSEYQEAPMGRRYSFNTTLDVKEGDLIESPDYEKKVLQVVAIQERLYKSFSFRTGNLHEEEISDVGYGKIKILCKKSRIVTEVAPHKDEGF